MFCEIARRLEDDDLTRIRSLEDELGVAIVAFACRSLDPEREEKLARLMQELGPPLQAPPATADDAQLSRIRALEEDLGLALIAVDASSS